MKKDIYYIAEKAGVSISTVSKVLNEKTHDLRSTTVEKVEQIIAQEEYVPNSFARAIVTKKTQLLALIIPEIANPFFSELVKGATDEAYNQDFSIIICNTDGSFEREKEYLKICKQLGVDGLILVTTDVQEVTKLLKDYTIPVVAVDRPIKSQELVAFVSSDNIQGTKDLVNYLLQKELKNIAYVGRKESNYLSDIRRTTVINTLKENNLNLKLDDKGDFIYEAGYDFIQKNRHQLQDIDCIICANDLIAFGVKSALNELNYKIPEDILITGYDDIMYSAMSQPTLTSVR